jgi:hypothetical protein
MELSQGNSPYSYLKQAKMSFLNFILQNQRIGAQKRSYGGGGAWYQWEEGSSGENVWEGEYSANTIYTYM